MEAGIQPQIVACRARNEVTETVRQKIAMFSNVPIRRVFSMHDRESIYTIPEDMRREGLDREVLSILQLHDAVSGAAEDEARRALDEIRRAARDDENVMPALVDGALHRCTLGEMVQALADVYGRYTGGPEW